MTRETTDWLNRVGLILGFLSFWFAAPEFIGVERLRKWEYVLAKVISKFPLKGVPIFMASFYAGILAIAFFFDFADRMSDFVYNFVGSRQVSLVFFFVLLLAIPVAVVIVLRRLLNMLPTIVSKLANDANVRQTALFIGAVLFTVSFLLQLIGTFGQ
jgi:hypothetical protein